MPLFGILRTRLGYLLLDKAGCQTLLAQAKAPVWQDTDMISRLTRRNAPLRGAVETGLRRIALDRATPSRLGRMLKRHLPAGTVYFNTGQTNFTDRMIHSLAQCERLKIVPYVHDTIPLDWPDTQTQKSRLKFQGFFKRVERYADLVLCNSNDTKAHILKHARRLNPLSVKVIWPGLPKMTLGAAPAGPWSGKPYFMAIGTIEPRKNIGFLLDLWTDHTGPNAPRLLICGRRGWLNEDVFQRLDQSPPNVHELPNLSDPEMWALLQGSTGLLFPSRAEGFGYPAIEAAQLKVPLICNPLPALREVLGDYPIYAGESDRYLWATKIEQLTQRCRGQSGEQTEQRAFDAPGWQAHFNRLFTLL
ncbi:glycosyltransferase [Marivita sp. S2033]|uniref:glycosyltransferase n=1 Tax=Marivita sp. S2033 TaxID=3373187 RepID=UPI00398213E3